MRLFMRMKQDKQWVCTPLLVSPGTDTMGLKEQICPRWWSGTTWVTGVSSCRKTPKVGAGSNHLPWATGNTHTHTPHPTPQKQASFFSRTNFLATSLSSYPESNKKYSLETTLPDKRCSKIKHLTSKLKALSWRQISGSWPSKEADSLINSCACDSPSKILWKEQIGY